jgi:hypothetical protein
MACPVLDRYPPLVMITDAETPVWETLATVAGILGATVDPPDDSRWSRSLRLTPFQWCQIRPARARGYSGPYTQLEVTAPQEIGGSHKFCARVSLAREPRAIAADIRRRVLDPCKEPLRAYFAQKAAQEAQDVEHRQTMAEIESALGEPLKADYNRHLVTPSASCRMQEYDARSFTDSYDKRPRYRATFTVDNLPAFLMLCRIAGECSRLQRSATPPTDAE